MSNTETIKRLRKALEDIKNAIDVGGETDSDLKELIYEIAEKALLT